MAVIVNRTGHIINFQAYDADKVHMVQFAPAIASGQARYVNQDHLGSADYFYILAFFTTQEFNPPPGIGIASGPLGAGGGITIAGTGGSFSATVTQAFSQPVACAKVQRHDLWTLNQTDAAGDLQFAAGGNYDNGMLQGW